MKVKMLKALNGDSFIISIPSNKRNINILVDGGTRETYACMGGIKQSLDEIIEQGLECIIITHIDDDHIAGIIEMFNKKNFDYLRQLKIKKIIYNYFVHDSKDDRKANNSNLISYRQGTDLGALLKAYKKYLNEYGEDVEIISCKKHDIIEFDNIKIYILTPNIIDLSIFYQKWINENRKIAGKSDYNKKIDDFLQEIICKKTNITNKSSISFLLTAQGKKLLMSGDANPYDIINSIRELKIEKDMIINKIKVDAIKVSHHGGEGSICEELFELIECSKYLISTNGRKYYHPRKKVLVDIWRRNNSAKFYLNYRRDIFKVDGKCIIDCYEDQDSVDV